MGKPSVELPDVPDHWTDVAPLMPEVGEYYLPGLGRTYLNPEFADKIGNFIQGAKDRGISLHFTQGYRDQSAQDALHNDPTAITPAVNSLHSAGRAVDVHWRPMGPGSQSKVVEAGKAAGLSWGGDDSKPDPVHFYYDPGTDRRELIDRFSQGIAALNGQIPDH